MAVTVAAATAAPASAFVVSVGGQDYDVQTTPSATFVSIQSLLESQVFWNNESLAEAFAAAVKGEFGLPNFGFAGPAFAWQTNPPSPTDPGTYNPDLIVSAKVWTGSAVGGLFPPAGDFNLPDGPILTFPLVWATATPVTPATSVPGPVPLFGAAAAFGWSRRLKRRITAS
ncbi:hypothetical protein [Cyanobium sp. N5-Cardenillas]|uniref:hypothetical protein n=1 Tax=Cyanobium sp. N5-Cardenillas TaxID=2823720 RepID=UPI0020CED760|nr:hypothetical protein [Cyanobium sp. N5-Cardenillas]MCP9786030.1 hypothetical protein [Cyanobium sp. N5-Cardenillas]